MAERQVENDALLPDGVSSAPNVHAAATSGTVQPSSESATVLSNKQTDSSSSGVVPDVPTSQPLVAPLDGKSGSEMIDLTGDEDENE